MRIACDTNVLIDGLDFKQYEQVLIPIVVIEELDKLKTDRDSFVSFSARKAIRDIKNAENTEIVIGHAFSLPRQFSQSVVDNSILAYIKDLHMAGRIDYFISKDYAVCIKAESLEIPVMDVCSREKEIFKGYREMTLSEDELAKHYSTNENTYNLETNEYLILKNQEGDVLDRQKWNGEKFVPVAKKAISSRRKNKIDQIEQVYPFDDVQACAIDSIGTNDFTMLTGRAGSGKTYLALSWLIHAIESEKITKIVIIHNNIPLKGAQKQGFLPGTAIEKILATNIGHILANKLGDISTVEHWIRQEKIAVIAASDCRGIEIKPSEALFISEAQNMDSYVLKTCIQRVKEGGKIIVEGDILEQQDIYGCDFETSGMYRAVEVFRGEKFFGTIKLKTNYRNPIADVANRM